MGLIGGALKSSITKLNPGMSMITIFIIGLLVIFIKAYIVQVSYNHIVEKVTGNKYKLTYMDSLFMVILFMGLF